MGELKKLNEKDYNRVLEITKELTEIRKRNNLYSIEIKDEESNFTNYDFKSSWDNSMILTRSEPGSMGCKITNARRNSKGIDNFEPSYNDYLNYK